MYNIKNEYETLVKNYHASLYRLLYGYCKNRSDAEDAIQAAYLRLLQCKKSFLSESHAKNWLYKVAVNYAKDIMKSRWKQVEELDGDVVFKEDQQLGLYEAVSALDEKYRIVILLYYYEGYSVKDIGKMLSVKESTIQTRLQRAREQLRERLEEWKDE